MNRNFNKKLELSLTPNHKIFSLKMASISLIIKWAKKLNPPYLPLGSQTWNSKPAIKHNQQRCPASHYQICSTKYAPPTMKMMTTKVESPMVKESEDRVNDPNITTPQDCPWIWREIMTRSCHGWLTNKIVFESGTNLAHRRIDGPNQQSHHSLLNPNHFFFLASSSSQFFCSIFHCLPPWNV